jgi:hypothetical protein
MVAVVTPSMPASVGREMRNDVLAAFNIRPLNFLDARLAMSTLG